MPDKHAKLGPSSAARWINCPGSVKLSEGFKPTSSSYADEGTEAHALGEIKLRFLNGEISEEEFRKQHHNATLKAYYSGEMEEATDYYRDQVFEAMASKGCGVGDLAVEQRLPLEDYIPDSFGTGDAVILGDDFIHIIDLKYGKGVKVDAENNPQLMLYGLGAASLFEDIIGDIKTVYMTIVQPRLDHVSSWSILYDDLKVWADNTVKPAAEKAMNGTDETACGDWCKFCPARATCRTRAEVNLDLARMEFKKGELLTKEEIGEVLSKAEDLKAWAADIEAYALEQALQGEQYDGWKVVEGRSNRKYSDEIKVAEALKAAGFKEAMLYEKKLYGITAMEKVVGKKKLAEICADLIVKPEGKPTLVPESDKREAINSAESAKADFK